MANGCGAYGIARFHLVRSFDDQPITGLEACGHEPFVAYRLCCRDGTLLDFVCAIDDKRRGIAFGITADPLLGREYAIGDDCLRGHDADEHAGEEETVRIGEARAQGDRAAIGVHDGLGKFYSAFKRIVAAVVQF